MAKKGSLSGTLSTVTDFLSPEAQAQLREKAGILSPLPLASIRPDPHQPRQLLPGDLAAQVHSGELAPAAAMTQWQQRARADAADAAPRRDLEELQRLADSIAQHGLINPISVRRVPGNTPVPAGVNYLIVTGERRYWAHVLLALAGRSIQEGLETRSPETIKATIAAEGVSIRAHQIVENVMREDIDAVEKAQGFLALRYELSGIDEGGVNHGSPPASEDQIEGGRNHGSPLVSWGQVEKALNISDRYRRYVTAVLNLDPRAQAIIRRHRLSERAIRPISQRLGKQPELQVAALNRIVAWQEENAGEEQGQAVTKAVAALVESMLAQEERRAARATAVPISKAARQAAELESKVAAALRFLDGLGEAGRTQLAQELRAKEDYAGTLAEMRQLRGALEEILGAADIDG